MRGLILVYRSFWLSTSLLTILLGCSDGQSAKNFGSPILNRNVTPIAELFDYPNEYNGKVVTIKGVIDMQDQGGHWFYMQDEEARIYVESDEADFTVPNLKNKAILAEGLVEVKMNVPSLSAKGVELQ